MDEVAGHIDRFFAGLSWKTVFGDWVGADYEIAPTTELLIHPSIRNDSTIGTVLRGEGWRCTTESCGHEDLTGLRMRRSSIEIVDLEATVAKLSTGAS